MSAGRASVQVKVLTGHGSRSTRCSVSAGECRERGAASATFFFAANASRRSLSSLRSLQLYTLCPALVHNTAGATRNDADRRRCLCVCVPALSLSLASRLTLPVHRTDQDLVDRISYSDRYSDDEFEYRSVPHPRTFPPWKRVRFSLTRPGLDRRHVQLPRQMLKLSTYPQRTVSLCQCTLTRSLPLQSRKRSVRRRLPSTDSTLLTLSLGAQYFEPDSNVLRLLTEDEWRGIGIVSRSVQSRGKPRSLARSERA